MDLDVVMRSSDCKYIVKFYGALFTEVMTPKNIVLVCFLNQAFIVSEGEGLQHRS